MPKYNLPTAAAASDVAAALATNVVAMPISTPTYEGWLYRPGGAPVWTTFHALPGTDPNVDGAYWYELKTDGESMPECLAGHIGHNVNGEPIFVDYGMVVLTSDKPLSMGGGFYHQDAYLQSLKMGIPMAIHKSKWFGGKVCGYHIAAYKALSGNSIAEENLKWLMQTFQYQP